MVWMASGYIMTEDKKANRGLGQNCSMPSFFLTGIERNIFTKSVAAYHIHEAILIFSSKDTTSGMLAVIRGTSWLSLFMVILQDSSSFFRG